MPSQVFLLFKSFVRPQAKFYECIRLPANMHKRLPANGVTKVQGVWWPEGETGQPLRWVYHHHYKGGTNDKKPLNSDQTLLGALGTAEGKLVVARQICNRFCPLALVPWSATLTGLRKRIEQLYPNLPDHRNQKVAKLDLWVAYEKGYLRKGSFVDISTSSKFDAYFHLCLLYTSPSPRDS